MTTSSDTPDHHTADMRRAKPLALALGGGGALGAAHVGVLRALWERDIRPDLVIGTSAGSIVGAAYAAGMPIGEIERTVLQSDWGTFGTLEMRPGIGLLNADGLAATIERIAGRALTIEELPIPFAAVATDVRSRKPVVIDSGSLADAIAASIAVPGIFRPRKAGKSYLVDGGVVQNLPLQTAFDKGAAHVIGVRVAAEWDVLPQLRTAVEVHELEIRTDVTMIRPLLGTRSQWIPADLPTLMRLGYEAAMRELPPPRGLRARWRSRRPAYGPTAAKVPSGL